VQKTAEPIQMLFRIWTQVGWSNLANTTEPYMCGSNGAFLSNYFDQLLLPATEETQLMSCRTWWQSHAAAANSL